MYMGKREIKRNEKDGKRICIDGKDVVKMVA